jgi:hypothetical protein
MINCTDWIFKTTLELRQVEDIVYLGEVQRMFQLKGPMYRGAS